MSDLGYIKTVDGVYPLKKSNTVHFDCVTKVDCTTVVFEGSTYWENNKIDIATILIDLADVLVYIQPEFLPKIMDIKLLYDEGWYNSFIKKIKEEGYEYYLSMWNKNHNLIKFAKLTEEGFKYFR